MKKLKCLNLAFIIALLAGGGISLGRLSEAQSTPPAKTQNSQDYFFKVYGADKEAKNEEVNFYLKIPKNLSLLEKLKIIADKLSTHQFKDHPIHVLKIEKKNNQKIAHIDLKELPGKGHYTWRSGYFQGSTGGHFTQISLQKTFLQEDYSGPWIDGVQFYYEGKPMEEMEHINLSGVRYRRKK